MIVPPLALHVIGTPVIAFPFVSFAVAVKVNDPPAVVLAVAGETVIDASVGEVGVEVLTVTVALPEIEPLVAFTVNVPAVEPAV